MLAFSRVADRREYPAVIPINLVKRQMPSILQRSDYVDFLLRMKFDDGDPLSACSREAYADFKRTLRGIGKSDVFPRAAEARQRANEALNLMIRSIRDKNPVAQKARKTTSGRLGSSRFPVSVPVVPPVPVCSALMVASPPCSGKSQVGGKSHTGHRRLNQALMTHQRHRLKNFAVTNNRTRFGGFALAAFPS